MEQNIEAQEMKFRTLNLQGITHQEVLVSMNFVTFEPCSIVMRFRYKPHFSEGIATCS